MLDIDGVLKPNNLVDIFRILEESKDTCFQIWEVDKYHKVTEFVNQLRMTDCFDIDSEYSTVTINIYILHQTDIKKYK